MTSSHIVTLGFIVNSCPGRSLLEQEKKWMMTHGVLEDIEYRINHSNGDEKVAMIVMMIILIASAVLCCYVCLKNRRNLCKRGGNVDGPAVPPELPGVQ